MNVLVIVPTYNERENLPLLVRSILEYQGHRVMVVDDQSPDGTGAVADELAREFPGRVDVLHRAGPRGLGRSYLQAFKIAILGDADVVCQMDADLSHDPKYLPALVAATGDYDLVVGSRYLHGISVVNWPLRRILLSTFANRYVQAVTRLRIHDCTNAYRCWRREALARMPLDRIKSEGYSLMVEMLYLAVHRNCRVTEVPIIFVERRQGQSKLSRTVLMESLITPWRVVWQNLRSQA